MIEKTEAWKVVGHDALFSTEEEAERWGTIWGVMKWFKDSGIEIDQHEAVHIVDNYHWLHHILDLHKIYEGGEDEQDNSNPGSSSLLDAWADA